MMYCPDYDCEKRLEDIKKELKAEKALRRIKIRKYKDEQKELKGDYESILRFSKNQGSDLADYKEIEREVFSLLNSYNKPNLDYDFNVSTWKAAIYKIKSLLDTIKYYEKEQ